VPFHLEDLGAIATQLGRLAAGLEAFRPLGDRLVIRGHGSFRVEWP
jgi:hypothetical protein